MDPRVEMLVQRLEAAQAFLRVAVRILREVEQGVVRLRAQQPSAERSPGLPLEPPLSQEQQELDALETRLEGLLDQVQAMHRLSEQSGRS